MYDICHSLWWWFGNGLGRNWMELQVPLIFVNGNLNAQKYCDSIIQPHVIPYFNQMVNRRNKFMHDNAPAHTARITTQALVQSAVSVIEWPAFSPDCNPIEHLWDTLGRRVRAQQRRPRSLLELRGALRQEWNHVSYIEINRLISSVRRRVKAVYDADGGYTRY